MASNRSSSCYSGLIPPKQLCNEADLAAEQEDPVNGNECMAECERCDMCFAYTEDGPSGPMTIVRRRDAINDSYHKEEEPRDDSEGTVGRNVPASALDVTRERVGESHFV